MMVSDIGDVVTDLAKKAGVTSQADMDKLLQQGTDALLKKFGAKPAAPAMKPAAAPVFYGSSAAPDGGVGIWPFVALVGGVGILAVAFFAGKGGKAGKAANAALNGLGLPIPRG
jgi:hypothetical protein